MQFSELLERYGTDFAFRRSQILIHQGHPVDSFYAVLSGKVEIEQMTLNGKSVFLCVNGPGSYLGDLEVFNSTTIANCTVQAVSSGSAKKIPLALLKDLAHKNLQVSNHLAESLALKLANYSVTSTINLVYPLKARLAHYLWATIPGKDWEPIAMAERAGLMGSSPRHLQRVLAELEESGAIIRQGKKLKIQDRSRLAYLADKLC